MEWHIGRLKSINTSVLASPLSKASWIRLEKCKHCVVHQSTDFKWTSSSAKCILCHAFGPSFDQRGNVSVWWDFHMMRLCKGHFWECCVRTSSSHSCDLWPLTCTHTYSDTGTQLFLWRYLDSTCQWKHGSLLLSLPHRVSIALAKFSPFSWMFALTRQTSLHSTAMHSFSWSYDLILYPISAVSFITI